MVDEPVLFDTNILIDFTRGIAGAEIEVQRYKDRAISRMTWVEVLSGGKPGQQVGYREFLKTFRLIEVSPLISEETVSVRRLRMLKLPDAVILATAIVESRILITRNTRDFTDGGIIRVPYRI
jgi:predicted nucleic acid-binding protein